MANKAIVNIDTCIKSIAELLPNLDKDEAARLSPSLCNLIKAREAVKEMEAELESGDEPNMTTIVSSVTPLEVNEHFGYKSMFDGWVYKGIWSNRDSHDYITVNDGMTAIDRCMDRIRMLDERKEIRAIIDYDPAFCAVLCKRWYPVE